MKSAIREFGNNIAGGDVALFYYAGHGAQVSGENYLIPMGPNANDRRPDRRGTAAAIRLVFARQSFFHILLKSAGSSFAPERLLATRAITNRRSERRLR